MKRIITLLVFLFILLSGCIFPPTQKNLITVSPSKLTVHVGDIFIVSILCDLAQPMKGWETEIRFNGMLLHATKVEHGSLFNGANYFGSQNIAINNSIGSITKVYTLVIGSQSISGSGSLLEITFVALAEGHSDISLAETALYNATESIPFEVKSATIRIDP